MNPVSRPPTPQASGALETQGPVAPREPGRALSTSAAAAASALAATTLSLPMAAAIVCDAPVSPDTLSRQALAATCKVAGVGDLYAGRALLRVPGAVTMPLGRVAPASLYLPRLPQKLADALAAQYGHLVDGIPWANERALWSRLPGAAYPADCDPWAPEGDCPDIMGYLRAAQWTPYMQAGCCVATGALVGAAVGAVTWRYGVHWLARLPNEPIAFDERDLRVPDRRHGLKVVRYACAKVARAAQRELARREAQQSHAPHPADERAPLLPRENV